MLFIRPDSAVQTEAESLRGDSFFWRKKAVRTAQIIQYRKECAKRKITVKQWCDENRISKSYYWDYHKKISYSLGETACHTGASVRCVSPNEL